MRIEPSLEVFKSRDEILSLSEKKVPSFSHWLTQHVSQTNGELNRADEALQQLAAGETQELHQTMVTLETAKLSLNYLSQIRNRLLSAYQDLLREQI